MLLQKNIALKNYTTFKIGGPARYFVEAKNVGEIKEAVNFAFQNTPKGQICLLSTASPSYSVWKNFEEKGDLFQRLVKNGKM